MFIAFGDRDFLFSLEVIDYFNGYFVSVVDLRGGTRDACPPSGPKFLHFHAVFGENWPNNRLAPPPLGLVPPPLGNPGSATACIWLFKGTTVNIDYYSGYCKIFETVSLLICMNECLLGKCYQLV